MAVPPDTKHNLFVSQIAICVIADRLTKHRLTSHFPYIVEVNSLFVTSDDAVQNFDISLIFNHINADLNTSALICLNQLMQYPTIELVCKVQRCQLLRITHSHYGEL